MNQGEYQITKYGHKFIQQLSYSGVFVEKIKTRSDSNILMYCPRFLKYHDVPNVLLLICLYINDI